MLKLSLCLRIILRLSSSLVSGVSLVGSGAFLVVVFSDLPFRVSGFIAIFLYIPLSSYMWWRRQVFTCFQTLYKLYIINLDPFIYWKNRRESKSYLKHFSCDRTWFQSFAPLWLLQNFKTIFFLTSIFHHSHKNPRKQILSWQKIAEFVLRVVFFIQYSLKQLHFFLVFKYFVFTQRT